MRYKATITFEFDTDDYTDQGSSATEAEALVDEMMCLNADFPDEYKVEVVPC